MADLEILKNKYPVDPVAQQKEILEKEMSNAHTKNINMSALAAELAFITEIYNLYSQFNKKIDQYSQAVEIIVEGSDKEMIEIAGLEKDQLESEITSLDAQIQKKIIEQKLRDPDDMKSVILEIRGGAGGDEAAIFAGDLFRMYQAFANSKSWGIELISTNISENGGYKEVIARIEGKNVYKFLKYESGVHRVQRIPLTESGGRIHTSTASVAILPEAEAVEVDIKDEDLKVETMRASGAGGQHVNKTSSAIRITHIPSGIVVSCQDSRVQQENRKRAMQLLNARLYEKKREEEMKKRSDMRSSQIGMAMRSEKIRTYNYPQSRVTDHRVKISWHNLEEIMNGSIETMIEEINEAMLQEMLKHIDLNDLDAK